MFSRSTLTSTGLSASFLSASFLSLSLSRLSSFLSSSSALSSFLSLSFLSASFLSSFFFFLDLFVVALGRDGRGAVLGQHHHVGGGSLRAVERREIDAGLGGAVVGGGEEVEVLAVGVEGRAGGVAHAVGDLGGFVGFQRVEKDGVQLVVEVAVIGDPLGVRRPDGAEVGAEAAVDALIHEHRLAARGGLPAGTSTIPQAQVLVGVCDVLGVGRPGGVVEEAGLGAEVDDRGRLEAGLVVQVELVLAGGVGEVGDGLAVRAPGGIALGDAGGLGQVAGVAFLGRDGEDFAVRLEDGAGAGGRESGVLNLARGQGCAGGAQGWPVRRESGWGRSGRRWWPCRPSGWSRTAHRPARPDRPARISGRSYCSQPPG